MNSKYHPVSRPHCMPAPAIGCTTFWESTPPDRRHGSTTVKYRACIWTKTQISSDIVVVMCVYGQYVWCVCATIFRQLRLKSIQNRCLAVKTPCFSWIPNVSCVYFLKPYTSPTSKLDICFAKSHPIASTCYAHPDAMLCTCEFSWIYFIGARALHSTNQLTPEPFFQPHDNEYVGIRSNDDLGHILLPNALDRCFPKSVFSPTTLSSRPWNQHIIATQSNNPGHPVLVVFWKMVVDFRGFLGI